MEPVFTLPWSEYVVAERLQQLFKREEGTTVFLPLSRQEKGVDLALVRKLAGGKSRTVTVQVKVSRAHLPLPAKRESTVRYKNYLWFNRIGPVGADFYVLIGFFAPDPSSTARSKDPNKYQDVVLVFSQAEMVKLMDSCLTVRDRNPDRYFGFGFDEPDAIYQTRGDPNRQRQDFSHALLRNKGAAIRMAIGLPAEAEQVRRRKS